MITFCDMWEDLQVKGSIGTWVHGVIGQIQLPANPVAAESNSVPFIYIPVIVWCTKVSASCSVQNFPYNSSNDFLSIIIYDFIFNSK